MGTLCAHPFAMRLYTTGATAFSDGMCFSFVLFSEGLVSSTMPAHLTALLFKNCLQYMPRRGCVKYSVQAWPEQSWISAEVVLQCTEAATLWALIHDHHNARCIRKS